MTNLMTRAELRSKALEKSKSGPFEKTDKTPPPVNEQIRASEQHPSETVFKA